VLIRKTPDAPEDAIEVLEALLDILCKQGMYRANWQVAVLEILRRNPHKRLNNLAARVRTLEEALERYEAFERIARMAVELCKKDAEGIHCIIDHYYPLQEVADEDRKVPEEGGEDSS